MLPLSVASPALKGFKNVGCEFARAVVGESGPRFNFNVSTTNARRDTARISGSPFLLEKRRGNLGVVHVRWLDCRAGDELLPWPAIEC